MMRSLSKRDWAHIMATQAELQAGSDSCEYCEGSCISDCYSSEIIATSIGYFEVDAHIVYHPIDPCPVCEGNGYLMFKKAYAELDTSYLCFHCNGTGAEPPHWAKVTEDDIQY